MPTLGENRTASAKPVVPPDALSAPRFTWRRMRSAMRRQLTAPLSTRQLALLCRQLVTAYDAGIPLVRAFDVVGERASSRRVRDSLRRLKIAVTRGATLTNAFHWQGRRFPDFFVKVIAGSEASGTLSQGLRHLAEHYGEKAALQRKIVTAAAYPLCVFICATLIIPYFQLVGLQQFAHGSADAPQQFLVHTLTRWACFLGALWIIARLGIWAVIWDYTGVIVSPKIARKLALGQFFRALSLMLESGLGTTQSINRAASVAGNAFLRSDLLNAIPRIQQGATFTEAFAGCRFLNPTALGMLAVGEQSGKLDETLRHISGYYIEEGMFAIRNRLFVLEGLLIILVVLTAV